VDCQRQRLRARAADQIRHNLHEKRKKEKGKKKKELLNRHVRVKNNAVAHNDPRPRPVLHARRHRDLHADEQQHDVLGAPVEACNNSVLSTSCDSDPASNQGAPASSLISGCAAMIALRRDACGSSVADQKKSSPRCAPFDSLPLPIGAVQHRASDRGIDR
jgi:hypothetical protein